LAEFRTIKMSFWSDPFIESLDDKSKLLYIYMITCSHTSNLGILDVTTRKIAYETGLSEEDVKTGMDLLRREGKIVTDGTATLMLNFISNQTSGAPMVIMGLLTLFKKLESRTFRKALLEKYPFFTPKAYDGVGESGTASDGADGTEMVSDHIDTTSDPMHTVLGISSSSSSSSGSGSGKSKGSSKGKGNSNKNKISCSSGDERASEKALPPQKVKQLIDTSFEEFWGFYPRKTAKADARKAFNSVLKAAPTQKKKAEMLDSIAAHLGKYLEEIEARQTEEKYIAYPGTWLRATDFSEPPSGSGEEGPAFVRCEDV